MLRIRHGVAADPVQAPNFGSELGNVGPVSYLARPNVFDVLDRQSPKAPAEMPLLPIDRQTSLGELAYASLKEAIVRGEFSAGQKLTVRAVANALSVSTTPARDAIMRLIGEGALVNIGPKTVNV